MDADFWTIAPALAKTEEIAGSIDVTPRNASWQW
jgi:hypothetical protein